MKGRPSIPFAKGPTTVYEAEQFMQFFVNMFERHPERSFDEAMHLIKAPKGMTNVEYLSRMRDLSE